MDTILTMIVIIPLVYYVVAFWLRLYLAGVSRLTRHAANRQRPEVGYKPPEAEYKGLAEPWRDDW